VSAEVGGNTAFGVGVLNVDVTIQAGNPAAVGISNDAAQGGALRAMRFTLAPDALAGVFTPGWAHVSGMIRHTPPPPIFRPAPTLWPVEGPRVWGSRLSSLAVAADRQRMHTRVGVDGHMHTHQSELVFDGGRYGILLFYTTWHSMVRDCAFWRQTEAAVAWQTPSVSPWEGITLERTWFGDVPTAVDARACVGTSVRAACIDCLFRHVRTAVVRLPAPPARSGRASLLLRRCRGDGSPVLLEGARGAFPAVTTAFAFEVEHLIAGAMVDDVRGAGQRPLPGNVSLAVRLERSGLRPLPAPLPPDAEPPRSDLPQVPAVSRWVSVLDKGLVGDGVHDNAPALHALLQASAAQADGAVLFFPQGVYAFHSTITVPPPSPSRGGGAVAVASF
jgi:hypothetical protein